MKLIVFLLFMILLIVSVLTCYTYQKKAIFLPALFGLGKMPESDKDSYYDASKHFREASEDDRMYFFMQHPVFGGYHHMFFNAEENVLNAISYAKYSHFMETQGRKKQTKDALKAFNYLLEQMQKQKAKLVTCLYPEEEIEKDPYKSHLTGIFYQGESTMPLAIVVPGGGFISNVVDCEGYPVAMNLHQKGYSVFVVTYPIGKQLGESELQKQGEQACKQLVQVLSYLKQHEQELSIDLNDFAIFGFSAGGMMTTSYSFAGYNDSCDKYGLPVPKVIFPIYGLDWNVEPQEKDKGLAVYSIVGRQDPYGFGRIEEKIPVLNKVLGQENVCIRIYDGLEHGFGIGTGTVAENWLEDATCFWQKHRS